MEGNSILSELSKEGNSDYCYLVQNGDAISPVTPNYSDLKYETNQIGGQSMVRYYAYNPKDRGPRYIEITEEEYLKIKIQTDRWFISFGTCVLECEKAEYDDYYRHLEHYRYTLRNASRKRPDVLSMDAMEEEFPYETSVFSVHTEKSVEDEVMESMRIEQISHALSR